MAGDSYEEKAKLILQSRRNANVLVDLLEKVDSTCKDQVIKALSSLEIVFKGFFSQRLWYDSQTDPDIGGTETLLDTGILGSKGAKDDKKKNEFGRNAERIYASWAHRQYLTFVKDLLRLCGHTNRVIQRSALDCLMGFLVSDYNATISNLECNPKQCYFPTTLFSRIIDSIFFNDCNAVNSRITYFEQRYLGFADIQFYTLKSIHRISNGQSNSITMNENVKSAICSLLLKMSSGEKDQDLHGFVIDDTRKLQKFIKGSSERRRLFSDAWLSVMHLTLPTQNLKMILVNLHEKIMPQMDDPKLLIDFLTDCYNLEGPIALLALNGLFLLIQNYNIDYPDFFKKLYNLLDAHTFEVKYRDRLLVLTDLFLTSINLPRYMAAAFIKRLARICLRVSPDTIRVILVLIENLMKRHPSCKVLIHRKVSFYLFILRDS